MIPDRSALKLVEIPSAATIKSALVTTATNRTSIIRVLGASIKIIIAELSTTISSRARDRRCKNPYIREDALIGQLCGIIDEIEIDRLGARRIIDKEIGRFNKMQAKVLGVKEWDKPRDVDIKRYAKYLLEEGSVDVKRELLEQLRGKLILSDKKISLQEASAS